MVNNESLERTTLQALAHRERQIEAIRLISDALLRHTDLTSMIRQTLDTSLSVFSAAAGSLLLHQPADDTLIFRYVVGPVAAQLQDSAIPATQGIAGLVFQSGLAHLENQSERVTRSTAASIARQDFKLNR
jgi:hypothetical protein